MVLDDMEEIVKRPNARASGGEQGAATTADGRPRAGPLSEGGMRELNMYAVRRSAHAREASSADEEHQH